MGGVAQSRSSGAGVDMFADRVHPQVSFVETVIDPSSFFGQLRSLYTTKVLKAQLERMRESGAYSGFDLKWQPAYDVRPMQGAKTRPDGMPPNIFQECDVSTWMEAVCYFLASPDGQASPHRAELESCLEETVGRIEKAIQPDGYLGIYFTVVDPKGRFMNLRDMHELYEVGHLTEAALAHYHLTHSRRFLDVMIKTIDLLMATFGPQPNQLHGYGGHPELELAVLRLYSVTQDTRHLQFGRYLLEERGRKREDQGGDSYFVWEAKERRKDLGHGHQMEAWNDVTYCQAHMPLHEQKHIIGHSVRALYLTTAAADIGGDLLEDARRLLFDAIDTKMYVTGGVGSEPRYEGFSIFPHRLPQTLAEGGGYNETCASIAVMMTCERVLSHGLDPRLRDTLELCLLNNVLGGASLDGEAFAYANRLATGPGDTKIRQRWFDTACCPPNLARTMGMIGGYAWNATVRDEEKRIHLTVYLYLSGERTIVLPDGQKATARMSTGMPWKGSTTWQLDAPQGWSWRLTLPKPSYASDVQLSTSTRESDGFYQSDLPATSSLTQTFSLPVRLLAPHPKSGQDTLTVTRGPIVYVAEAIDNEAVERRYPHFDGIGLSPSTTFEERDIEIMGFKVVQLVAREPAFGLEEIGTNEAYRVVDGDRPARSWKKLEKGLVYTPWFARANRGDKDSSHIRTSMLRMG